MLRFVVDVVLLLLFSVVVASTILFLNIVVLLPLSQVRFCCSLLSFLFRKIKCLSDIVSKHARWNRRSRSARMNLSSTFFFKGKQTCVAEEKANFKSQQG